MHKKEGEKKDEKRNKQRGQLFLHFDLTNERFLNMIYAYRRKIQVHFTSNFTSNPLLMKNYNDIYIPSKEWNNTFPQAKEALNSANYDLKEIANNGALFGNHLAHVLAKETEELNYRKELLHDSKQL
jgi:hypothetical protein